MSKKRKGLSVDEKRDTLLRIYHERKEPLNLKEIENYGTKEGVVTQSIKEINQSLVDDNLLQSDKIGAGNFYWSFPSKAYQDLLSTEERLQAAKQSLDSALADLEQQIVQARQSRCAPDREQILSEVTAMLEEEKQLDRRLEELKANDPDHIDHVVRETKRCKVAANRWTDNIWMIKSHLVRKMGRSSKEADGILHIDSSFDYLED